MVNLDRFVPGGIVQLISFYIFPYKYLLTITEQIWMTNRSFYVRIS